MKVLIVGGAGYIGGAVTDILAQPCYTYGINFAGATEHQFRVYDSLLYEESYRKPVPFVRGDIRDHAKLLSQLAWADVVIWLAAVVGDVACALDPQISVEVNQDAVGWLAKHFDGRIIFMSTCSVYGAADEELTEESPTNPLSVYASTKLEAESYLQRKNAIIFRLGTLYGLSDTYSRVRFDLVVNTLTLRAQSEGRISVFGGEQYRPLLHVRDAARAVVDAIDQPATGIYNLHRTNMRIDELADGIATCFPNAKVYRTPSHFEDHRNYRVNSAKADSDLGFLPRTSVEKGVLEIRDLLDEGRLAHPLNPRYWNDQHLAQR